VSRGQRERCVIVERHEAVGHAAIRTHHMGALLAGNTPVNLAFYSKKKFAGFSSFYESIVLNKRWPNSIKLN